MTDTPTPLESSTSVRLATPTLVDEVSEPRSKRFLDRVANVLADLTEVKVVTIVGDVVVTLKTTSGGKTTETEIGDTTVDQGSIISIFKVIDGDMTTTISPDRIKDTELLAKHEEQLEKSLQVLPDHLKKLVEIVKGLDDI